MLSLQAIAHWEAAVAASIAGARGTIEERDAQITRSGMYAEYPAIFASYLELSRDSADPAMALEALKRALFVAWYSFVEPPVATGIAELPESGVRELMTLVDRVIGGNRGDEELRLMLVWYQEVFGYPFEHFGPVRSLRDFTDGLTMDDVRGRRAEIRGDPSRGQLGSYWRAALGAA